MLDRMRSEQGSLWPLFIVFGIVIMGLSTVVLDVTHAFTYRRYVSTIADGAALAGADGIDEEAVYTGGVDEKVKLDNQAADAKIAEYMRQVTGPSKPSRCWRPADVTDGKVTVHCEGTVALPMSNWITAKRLEVKVELDASAEAHTQGGP